MALFKILRGNREALDEQELHDGYAYFTPDTGEFFIDYLDNSDGQLYRKKISDTTKASVQICDWTVEEEIEYVSFTLSDNTWDLANMNNRIITIENPDLAIGGDLSAEIIIPETFEKDGIYYKTIAINDISMKLMEIVANTRILNIPSSVESISAFDFMHELAHMTQINFGGTETQWNAIMENASYEEDFDENFVSYVTEIVHFNTYNG